MKILIAIPACKTLQYTKWESAQSPLYDQTKAYLGKPYGEDIHFSGPNDRLAAVRETWAQDCAKNGVDLKFFYGGEGEALPDEVYLPCEDDYAHLCHKVIEICRWALANGYDWIMKCDDDTYVWVDRLVKEVQDVKFDYAGYQPRLNCSGGPGYWLSRRAMEVVVANANPNTQWAEDVMVGDTLAKSRITAKYLTAHFCGGPNHWFDIKRPLVDAVTIHAVAPTTMRQLWKREHPNS